MALTPLLVFEDGVGGGGGEEVWREHTQGESVKIIAL